MSPMISALFLLGYIAFAARLFNKASKKRVRKCDYCVWQGLDFDEHYLSAHSMSSRQEMTEPL